MDIIKLLDETIPSKYHEKDINKKINYNNDVYEKKNYKENKLKHTYEKKKTTYLDKRLMSYLDFNKLKEESDIKEALIHDGISFDFVETKVNDDEVIYEKYFYSSHVYNNTFKITNRINKDICEVECVIKGRLDKKNRRVKKIKNEEEIPQETNLNKIENNQDDVECQYNFDENKNSIKEEVKPNKFRVIKDINNNCLTNLSKKEYVKTWITTLYEEYLKLKDSGGDYIDYQRKKSICYVSRENKFIIISTEPIIPNIVNGKKELTKEQIINFKLKICPIDMSYGYDFRELDSSYVEYLKKVKQDTINFIKDEYNLESKDVYMCIPNLSKKSYFRINLNHVRCNRNVDKLNDCFGLERLIYNLECEGEYYKKIVLNRLKEINNKQEKSLELLKTSKIKIYDVYGDINFLHGKKLEKIIKNDFRLSFIHKDSYYKFKLKDEDIFKQIQENQNILLVEKLLTCDTIDDNPYESYTATLILKGIIKCEEIPFEIRELYHPKKMLYDIPKVKILKNILKIKDTSDIYCNNKEIVNVFKKINIVKHLEDFSFNIKGNLINYKRWDNKGCIITQSNDWNDYNDTKKLKLNVYPFILEDEIKFLKNIRSLGQEHIELIKLINNHIDKYVKTNYKLCNDEVLKFLKIHIDLEILEINVSHVNTDFNIDYDTSEDLDNIIFNMDIKPNYYQEFPIIMLI